MSASIHVNVTEAVNFRLNTDTIANLKKIARHVSYHLDKDFSYVDLIRCLLADNFPIPQTSDELESQMDAAIELLTRVDSQAAAAGVAKFPQTFTITGNNQTVTFTHFPKMNENPDAKDGVDGI